MQAIETRGRILAIGAVALGITIALILAEIVLRAAWPQRSPETVGMFQKDPHAGFRLKSDYRNEIRTPEFRIAIVTDSEGYRIPEGRRREPHGGSRVLVIGDSFTFGVGVNAEEAFPGVLADRLNAGGSGSWNVRNGGVGGYGPLRSSRLLLSHQASWRPSILVHAFYVGNDLAEPRPDGFLTHPEVRDGRMFSPGRHPWMRLRLMLRAHSHVYSFLRERLYGLYLRSGLGRKGQYLEPTGLKEWPAQMTEVGWPAGRQAIRDIDRWAEAENVKYLAVLVPAKYQVGESDWEHYMAMWDLPESRFDRDRAQRVVASFFAELDVPVLDLLPPLRETARRGARLYYPVDRHWTVEAHRLAAELIEQELIALGWVVLP